jgi:hypothetical protein
MNIINFSFEKNNEKLDMIYLIKQILITPLCYLRFDIRNLVDKIYCKVLNTLVIGQNQSNNIEVLFTQIYNSNKHLINFKGKKYADETWLYSFIRDDKNGINIFK